MWWEYYSWFLSYMPRWTSLPYIAFSKNFYHFAPSVRSLTTRRKDAWWGMWRVGTVHLRANIMTPGFCTRLCWASIISFYGVGTFWALVYSYASWVGWKTWLRGHNWSYSLWFQLEAPHVDGSTEAKKHHMWMAPHEALSAPWWNLACLNFAVTRKKRFPYFSSSKVLGSASSED